MENHDIYGIFDAGGLLSQRFPGYEYREGQLRMAIMVAESYRENAIAVVEAGTGIGKSFAYLVPALLHALEHPEDRTVIATATINLQKQLVDKDIVQLFAVLERSCPVALVVGRRNYLCLHRLEEQVDAAPLLSRDPLSELGALVAWSGETESGLRTDFPGRLRGEIWSDICSDSDLCLGYHCSYARDCFFMKARKKTTEARILVSNHHLLFTDARSRMLDGLDYDDDAVLPPFHRLVIDEAHNMEKNATDYFTATYSGYDMLRSIGRLSHQRRKSGKGLIEDLAPYVNDRTLPALLLGQISQLVEAIGDLDTYLIGFMQQRKTADLLILPHMRQELVDFNRLASVVVELSAILGETAEKISENNKVPEEMEYRLKEFGVHVSRLGASAEALRQFIDYDAWTADVHWFELLEFGKGMKGIEVHISPLSIAERMRESLFSRLETVVCTSATLDLHDNFTYWSTRVGLPLGDGRPYFTAVHISPFDFKTRLLLLTPNDAPVFSEQHPQDFILYCTNTIKAAVISSGGGALVLFTSYGMLMKVSQDLVAEFAKADIMLLRQGEMDRSLLLRQFTADKNSVLFATDSFWEGVDAPGDTLRLVIIVKLPFRVPTDPVFRARQEALEEQGGQRFFPIGVAGSHHEVETGVRTIVAEHHGHRYRVDTGQPGSAKKLWPVDVAGASRIIPSRDHHLRDFRKDRVVPLSLRVVRFHEERDRPVSGDNPFAFSLRGIIR